MGPPCPFTNECVRTVTLATESGALRLAWFGSLFILSCLMLLMWPTPLAWFLNVTFWWIWLDSVGHNGGTTLIPFPQPLPSAGYMVPYHPWITSCVDPRAFLSASGARRVSSRTENCHLNKINLNFSQNSKCFSLPQLSSAQSEPGDVFLSLEAVSGLFQAGQEGEMKKERTSVPSGWQMSKYWLFLWLGTYVWISLETLNSSLLWTKSSHLPRSSCSDNLLLTASPPRWSLGLSPTHTWVGWGRG